MKYKLKLTISVFGILFTNCQIAHSAVWTKEKGNIEIITSYAFSTNKPEEFATGDFRNERSYFDKQECKLYSEYGITNELTAGFAVEHDTLRVGNDVRFKSEINDEKYPTEYMQGYFTSIGITEADFNALSSQNKKIIYEDFLTEQAKTKTKEQDAFMKIFMRKKLFQNKNIAMSFQPTFQFPLTKKDDISEKINYINTKKSLELMFSLGSSFEYKNINSIFNQYHFVNLNLGYKKIFDNFYDEINLEFAGGVRMNQTSFMLLEIFRTYNNQSPSKYGLNNPFKRADREYSANQGAIVKELNADNNHFLRTEKTQIKLSSITQFSDSISAQIAILGTHTKYDNLYGVEISLWFNL